MVPSRLYEKVARRFLAETLGPKDYLKIFQGYQRKILGLVKDPTQAQAIKDLYLEMAEKVRPLAFALEGVQFKRPDEIKKLKNLQMWLRIIQNRTKPEIFEGEEESDIIRAAIQHLEILDEVLKSVARTGARLEEYSSIEKTFTHGSFEIINQYGFRPTEYEEPLKSLDKASDLISKAGFSSVLYGKVFLTATKEGWAGRYMHSYDTVELNVLAKYRVDDVYTLVHELGHRYWHKNLTDAQRDAYEDQYTGKALNVTVKERELFWEALEKAEFDPKRAVSYLAKDLQEKFRVYWQDRKKNNVYPTKKDVQELPEMVYKNFVRPKTRVIVLDESAITSVTDYGRTNVLEDFAEVFAHYCTGQPLTDDALERFQGATGKRLHGFCGVVTKVWKSTSLRTCS